MFRRKLHNHERKALTEALACMNTLTAQGVEVDTQAVDTIKAMLGIRGVMPKHINEAIAECTEREREVAWWKYQDLKY